MSYGAKMMAAGVGVKAVVMAGVVTLLAATTFWESVVLVLISAIATGCFAIVVVMVQARSERSLHDRLDRLERQTTVSVARKLEEQTKTIVESVEQAGQPPATGGVTV